MRLLGPAMVVATAASTLGLLELRRLENERRRGSYGYELPFGSDDVFGTGA